MQLDGIGSSTMINSSNSSNISHLSSTESKPRFETRTIPNRERNDGEQRYVEEKRFSEGEVIDIIEKANKDFVVYDRRFEFSIHEKTKEIMVKVIDTTNGEVIRELPPEKVLDMVAAIWEVVGIIVDKKI
ncbi:flagellar protein FlaG [Tissierella sp.]|uniref:flagellar protein FlaG n=1 Tax=Tissierella sp. TaxID=41274 RepID=UPI00285C93BE|nr:flagellar protein FlaG [Tissierella sp.]MDR7856881.1 flagellar protein FlaG [Tissierella sp.]